MFGRVGRLRLAELGGWFLETFQRHEGSGAGDGARLCERRKLWRANPKGGSGTK